MSKLDFKDKKFPDQIRDICNLKNFISISAFGYENKKKIPVYISKNTSQRYVVLLFIDDEG